jgi:hypothetical protein
MASACTRENRAGDRQLQSAAGSWPYASGESCTIDMIVRWVPVIISVTTENETVEEWYHQRPCC